MLTLALDTVINVYLSRNLLNMTFENRMTHTQERRDVLVRDNDKGPVSMVNLLKFKDKAVYEDGRETQLSGLEAYNTYGVPMGKLIAEGGGKVTYTSEVDSLVVGEADELWDIVVILEYPSREKFLELISSPEAQLLQVHRTAGLAGQMLLATSQIWQGYCGNEPLFLMEGTDKLTTPDRRNLAPDSTQPPYSNYQMHWS